LHVGRAWRGYRYPELKDRIERLSPRRWVTFETFFAKQASAAISTLLVGRLS